MYARIHFLCVWIDDRMCLKTCAKQVCLKTSFSFFLPKIALQIKLDNTVNTLYFITWCAVLFAVFRRGYADSRC
jgi:hypothetical protein